MHTFALVRWHAKNTLRQKKSLTSPRYNKRMSKKYWCCRVGGRRFQYLAFAYFVYQISSGLARCCYCRLAYARLAPKGMGGSQSQSRSSGGRRIRGVGRRIRRLEVCDLALLFFLDIFDSNPRSIPSLGALRPRCSITQRLPRHSLRARRVAYLTHISICHLPSYLVILSRFCASTFTPSFPSSERIHIYVIPFFLLFSIHTASSP
jgi:hypothetical protein